MNRLGAALVLGLSLVLVAGASLASYAEEGASAPPPVVPRGVELPSCGGRVFTSITGGWGPVSPSSCGVAGHPGYKVPYYWTNDSDPMMCTNGLGYRYTDGRYVAQDYYTGCGWTSRTYVSWGNVLAMPKMRANAAPPYVISAGWYNYL